ncbi:type I polyketide synthase [Nitrospira sp. T9]|uniref:type I polyketide synthase n=1 Tax=unclassified Nitrospira TaxID=2652172 RepID=UPI003F9A170B
MMNAPEPSSEYQAGEGLEVAIVGMAGRFPGANNLEMFWRNLQGGVESVSTLSREELLESGVEAKVFDRTNYVRARAVLDEVDLFDAQFFNMTPKEAEVMDPQQRLFLECAWETLERAGYDPEQYRGSIGVFAGSSTSGYLFNLFPRRILLQSAADMSAMLGVEKDSLSTRVSYKLNLEGPSIAVQTACSTSLVAVHLACQALLSGECDMALAGGVSISVPQKVGYLYQEGGIVSPDGHCRTFDADAQGTVGGSGVGLVLLKRLQEAEEDGDHILAVIKGSAINNDGAAKVGYTAPRIEGQAKVIGAAHLASGVTPDSISYVEAHGTGTPMGDPIEVAALTQAFRASTARTGFCALGSIKTNIGHLDAAAGIAGLIKTVLALSHRQIPASLHYVRPNPAIEFSATPFYVNRTLTEWVRGESPRRAGVSSFGLGGTNAHVVLEEAPSSQRASAVDDESCCQLLLLSARSEAALNEMTNRLATHLYQHPHLCLADIAHTLQSGRKAFPYRRWLTAMNTEEAARLLSDSMFGGGAIRPVEGEPRIAFMFSGQGSQYPDMGHSLYQQQPLFREHIDRCASIVNQHLDRDIRTVLFPGSAAETDLIHHTSLTQPALFIFEYALAQLWKTWGIHPHAMIGHSIGEYVAACLSGAFSIEDALAIVAMRGKLMQGLPSGSMLAVSLSVMEVTPFLNEKLDLAAVNAPGQCVVSGSDDRIAALDRALADQGIQGRRLKTSHAFHSSMMDPILKRFESFLAGIELQAPQVPWVSNVSGTWIRPEEAIDPAYWSRHLRSTVRFSEGVQTLLEQPATVLLEIGPGRTLQNLARRHPVPVRLSVLASLDGLDQAHAGQDEMPAILATLGSLWGAGVRVGWSGLHCRNRRRRVVLPTYPFERQRYWVEPGRIEPVQVGASGERQTDLSKWFYQPSWKRSALVTKGERRSDEQWLVFLDEQSTGAEFIGELERQGRSVITVLAGKGFERCANGTYRVRPDSRDDHESLVRELTSRDHLPACLLHAWTIGDEPNEATAVVRMQMAQEKGFLHLLLLAQIFAPRRRARLSILVLSNGLHDVTGEETLRPEQATLLGACRVIPQEYPGVTCRVIDLERASAAKPFRDVLCGRLIDEVSNLDAEPVVAYRGMHRWTQTFEPLILTEKDTGPSLLREEGVYLITGGLGGVGLCLAEYLIRTVRGRVILTSRTVPTPEQRERVAGLIRSGGRILTLQADVADPAQMQGVIDEARRQFGRMHGVFHAAGIAGGGLLELKTPETVWDEFRPKVFGALVLQEAFRDRLLDFVVFCSSLTAVVGGVGQAAYCAANVFLDAMAHAGTKEGTRLISVNFDRWRQVGMAVEAEAWLKTLQVPEAELDGMTPQEGQDVVNRILRGPNLPQIAVSIRDLPTVVASVSLMSLTPSQMMQGAAPSAIGDVVESLEQEVAKLWKQILGIERVGLEDDFFRLGGDSLSALQLLNRVQELYDARLSLREFFDAPTVPGLATQIRGARVTGAQQEPRIVPIPRQSRRLRGASV